MNLLLFFLSFSALLLCSCTSKAIRSSPKESEAKRKVSSELKSSQGHEGDTPIVYYEIKGEACVSYDQSGNSINENADPRLCGKVDFYQWKSGACFAFQNKPKTFGVARKGIVIGRSIDENPCEKSDPIVEYKLKNNICLGITKSGNIAGGRKPEKAECVKHASYRWSKEELGRCNIFDERGKKVGFDTYFGDRTLGCETGDPIVNYRNENGECLRIARSGAAASNDGQPTKCGTISYYKKDGANSLCYGFDADDRRLGHLRGMRHTCPNVSK